ncbi:MAG: copper chaperone PCu(A)C [Halieaceae bacterium]|nr:copper chaperone PCu(A)C [Halieaceae bacterium]
MFLSRTLLIPVLGLCSAVALASEPAVTLADAWIRALPPTQPVTAAYVAITNSGAIPITLTGADIDGVGRVEIHTTREVDGLVRMEQLTTLTIEPGETRALAPGGAHFMLFDLAAMPRAGDYQQMCLNFQDGGKVCTEAAVRKSADEGRHDHHQHH